MYDAPFCSKVVHINARVVAMGAKRKRGRPVSGKPPSVRATVSLPPDIHQTLGALARQKKVSMAWVMRDAAEKYVAQQRPLLGKNP
jgi:ribbon-helix-helix CopG family protein